MTPRVLIIEDGHEYVTAYQRFLGDAFAFVRAGDGREALALLDDAPFDAAVLDMRFDRADHLLGDLAATTARYGDAARARRFLEDNQGTFILAALREAGHDLPVVVSYDFGGEPRRFRNLARRYGPVGWLGDAAGPAEIRRALEAAVSGGLSAP